MNGQAVAPPPSGDGCVECLDRDGWWVHLRRCVECGHVGCCDSSPMRHARAHAAEAGHPVATSFEPGEDWFWDYVEEVPAPPVPLSPPRSRPADQAVPGGDPPPNWRELIH
ncbi:UBP-type zinc finger domain-containing protein [Agromyces sp. LHK192]|uniref:UBP-type zinc finger domain-containing protein n=1 Tax=Agromyces sp. LHK192 TaxID=2498704 RepID=UPI000FD9DB42|nr:UBP-type zinc finger domain-containing protein [Agromyces sp. LHK192]